MLQKLTALAIIPARGGSKRLPRKNLRLLQGKPLVCHTIEAAIESRCFTQIILSSDDEEILALGREYPEISAEPRPAHLASDQSKVLELVCTISSRPDFQQKYDIIALLLPTAPFRTAKHIQEGFKKLTDDFDSVVSVTPYEFPPQLSVTLDEEDNLIRPVFNPCPLITGDTRSQDQKLIYRPNGGFYISWWRSFLINQNFWKGKVKGYPMTRLESVDIDDEVDFQYAQFLLENQSSILD